MNHHHKLFITLAAVGATFVSTSVTNAATVALVNSASANATFNANFQSFIEARGDTFVRNPANYAGVDVVFNIRTAISTGLADWVRGGGYMIGEYTAARLAGTVAGGGAGLIDYTDTAGNAGNVNAGSGTPITLTPAGAALGLNTGLGTSYSDTLATEFFKKDQVVGSSVTILGTRPGPNNTTLPAIIGAPVGDGYFLGYIYDWGDAFTQTPPLANTQQLITNALAVPEPASLAIVGLTAVGLMRRRARRVAQA